MRLDFNKGQGLVPAVIQDAKTGRVMMLGYMNEESLAETKACGEVVFFSRSRGQRWKKGETSGNRLRVVQISADCDRDCLLIRVSPAGPVCHTGQTSCFDNGTLVGETAGPAEEEAGSATGLLESLSEIVHSRAGTSPDASYTARLLSEGAARVAQKVGEEAVELAIAAQSQDLLAIAGETADLLYHLAVLLECKGVALDAVAQVLASRRR